MSILIFDIKKFAINDGPGIRTTIFFKGCPLDCKWCHNPESKKMFAEKFSKEINLDNEVFTEELTIGKNYSINEIMEIILKDKSFYDTSGGGVTFSGGEPLLQGDYLNLLLLECKKQGIHTAIDTSGFTDNKTFIKTINNCDLLLFDIKHYENVLHKYYTAVDNDCILQNLHTAIESNIDIIIRIPIIKNVNDRLRKWIEFFKPIDSKRIISIDLINYHHFGLGKYKYNNDKFESVDDLFLNELQNIFIENGFNCNIKSYE